jgi:hypothetical protein
VSWSRAIRTDLALLTVLKIAFALGVLHLGFSHVSDDDYARVVIAQRFAVHPQLDPSGTSWLPFPFLLTGSALILFGHSLEVARYVAIVCGIAVVFPVYAALRNLRLPRWVVMTSILIASLTPWNAWLAVATVPEGLTGGLIASAIFLLQSPKDRVYASLLLMVAGFSRYEAWPVGAFVAVISAVSLVRARRRQQPLSGLDWAVLMLGVVAPVTWMAWNTYAHGSPLHFLSRVSRYRQSIGAANVPFYEKLIGFPSALVGTAPFALTLSVLGLVALSYRSFRRRWILPIAASGALLMFLILGDITDDAPTHHPERAILALVWVLSAFGIDGLRTGE